MAPILVRSMIKFNQRSFKTKLKFIQEKLFKKIVSSFCVAEATLRTLEPSSTGSYNRGSRGTGS